MPVKKPTTCPDCRQKLSEPQRPCGYLGGVPAWCATCESDDREQRAAAHRPRQDPTAARVVKPLRVHPDTARKLDTEAKRAGESVGQVVDRLAAALP